ncbi:hypothetical protein Dimus_022404 [Dionaea muscipula]
MHLHLSSVCILDKDIIRNTHGGIKKRDLKPDFHLLHAWILKNVLPKKGHFDVVPPFGCFIMFRIAQHKKLNLSYIILREMIRIRETHDGKALGFGVLLTLFFLRCRLDLSHEASVPIKGPFKSIGVNIGRIPDKIKNRNADDSDGASDDDDDESDGGSSDDAPAQSRGAASSPSISPQFYSEFQQIRLEMNDQFRGEMHQRLVPLESDSRYSTARLARMETIQNSHTNTLCDIEFQQGQALHQLQDSIDDLRRQLLASHAPPPPPAS